MTIVGVSARRGAGTSPRMSTALKFVTVTIGVPPERRERDLEAKEATGLGHRSSDEALDVDE